jgi:hypothetical protein
MEFKIKGRKLQYVEWSGRVYVKIWRMFRRNSAKPLETNKLGHDWSKWHTLNYFRENINVMFME